MIANIKDKLPFREFLYVDRGRIEDFVSAAVGGLPQQRSESSRNSTPRVDLEADVKVLKGRRTGGQRDIGSEEIRKATHASLFEMLHRMLLANEMLHSPGETGKAWDEIEAGEFVEIECLVELSGLERLLDLIRRFHRFMSVVSPGQVQDPQWQQIVQYLDALDEERDSYNVRLTPLEQAKGLTLVASLAKRHLRGDKAELDDNYTVLGRVQRKLQPGTTVELFNLLPEGFRLSAEDVRPFLRSFENMPPQLGKPPTMDDLRVSFPAIILTPIAIYR